MSARTLRRHLQAEGTTFQRLLDDARYALATQHLARGRLAVLEILAQIGASGLHYVERPVTIHYSAYSIAKGQKTSDSVIILLDLFARALYR